MTTALTTSQLVLAAGDSFCSIVGAASTAPLTARTPCQEWDLGALVRHLLFYAPVLAASGLRSEITPGAETEQDIALDSDWPERLEAAMGDVARAWGDPHAWYGLTTMSGSEPMPAPMIGGMVLGELVVHGWDLAMAAGVRPEFSDEVLHGADAAVIQMAELGRGMGVFGPEIPVGDNASVLDRIVARTGRDPGWAG